MNDQTLATDSSAPLRLALRPKDAATALGISPRLLWTMTNLKEIPHLRIGKTIVYPIDSLREWLAAKANGGK